MKILVIVSLILSVGMPGAAAAPDKKVNTEEIVTKPLFYGAVPGDCPQSVVGRPAVVISRLCMEAPDYVCVSMALLGGEGKIGIISDYLHDLTLRAYVEGEADPVGIVKIHQPRVSAGQFFESIPLNRELTPDEQSKLYVVLQVDGRDEFQRTLSVDLPKDYSVAWVQNLRNNKIGTVSLALGNDKEDKNKDYFYPYVLVLGVQDADGNWAAEPQYIMAWFKGHKYSCPEVVMLGQYPPGADLIVNVDIRY